MVENIGQGLKYQTRAGAGLHTEGGAGGEDDQTCGEGHEGIQGYHIDGLAHQRTVLFQIASENGHGTDAQTQREKGLVHGSGNDVDGAGFHETVPVRQQVEGQTLAGTLQQAAVDGQQDHDA